MKLRDTVTARVNPLQASISESLKVREIFGGGFNLSASVSDSLKVSHSVIALREPLVATMTESVHVADDVQT